MEPNPSKPPKTACTVDMTSSKDNRVAASFVRTEKKTDVEMGYHTKAQRNVLKVMI